MNLREQEDTRLRAALQGLIIPENAGNSSVPEVEISEEQEAKFAAHLARREQEKMLETQEATFGG